MLYFKLDSNLEVVEVASSMPAELRAPGSGANWYRKGDGSFGPGGWINRNDIDSFMMAQQIADSASLLGCAKYMATDNGPDVSPRFNVIECPSYNSECSMGFNGDFYPVGKIVRISSKKDYKVITVNGPRGLMRFYRRKLSGAWLNKGFSLVPGVISKWNPEF